MMNTPAPSRWFASTRLLGLAAAAALALVSSRQFGLGLHAQAPNPCAAPVTNPVACENTLTGNLPSEWDIT